MPEFDLFSSDSEDECKKRKSFRKSNIEESNKKKSINEDIDHKKDKNENVESDDEIKVAKTEYTELTDFKKLTDIPINTKLYYLSKNGKKVGIKYFKSYDIISKKLKLGFFTHDARNYEIDIDTIDTLHINIPKQKITGGDDKLKDTIEIDSDEWDKIQSGTVLSYQKKDGGWVYNAVFNSIVMSKKDNVSRMSLKSASGMIFLANPSKIDKIYRHITPKDKTLIQILQSIKKMELRITRIEKNIFKKDTI